MTIGDFLFCIIMSIRKQHYFVHYYCHHTVRYIQIFFTTLKVKCAPKSFCLQINICVYIFKHGLLLIVYAHINVNFFVIFCKIYTIVAQCMFLLCSQSFTTQNYISCRVFTYIGILPRCIECFMNVRCN